MTEVNIVGKHLFLNARQYGNAYVFDEARVYDNAHVCDKALVCGNARVCGNAGVCGDAYVYGNARVSAGIIDGNARIGSPDDLIQVIVHSDVWSRFRTKHGYRTTCTKLEAIIPEHVAAFFDAWEADRD